MRPLRYHRPQSLAEALAMFTPDARYIAGGQTLLPALKLRLAAPADLVDVARLPELQGIAATADTVTVGGGVSHYAVAGSDVVRRAIPALAELAGSIGDPAVRHLGTIGGSLANNDPAADYPAAVLALGAIIHTDRRQIAAADFFRGLFATALADGEIVTRVVFPVPAKAAYRKLRNLASGYALAGTFVARMPNGEPRVGVTGAGSGGVFRATAMEGALARNWSAAALADIAVDPATLLSDIHATADYRANLVAVMARRAVTALPA